jgi:hypothetical protein
LAKTLEKRDVNTKVGAEQRVKAWARKNITDIDEVSVPQLTNKAVEHFKHDEGVLEALLDHFIRPIIYQIVFNEVAATRQDDGLERVVDPDGQVVSVAERERALKVRWGRFQRWLEYDGMRHARFLKMDREQLLSAANKRKARAKTELDLARFFEVLAGDMEAGVVVEEVYSPGELEAIYHECTGK